MVITLLFTTLRTFRAQPSIRPSPCRGRAETQPSDSLLTVQGRKPSHQSVSLQYRGKNPAIRQSPYSTGAETQPSESPYSTGAETQPSESPYSTGAETQPSDSFLTVQGQKPSHQTVSLQYRAETQPSDSFPTVQGRKPNHQSPYSTGAETQSSDSLPTVQGRKPSHQAVACCLETGTQPSGNCWAVSGQKPSQ